MNHYFRFIIVHPRRKEAVHLRQVIRNCTPGPLVLIFTSLQKTFDFFRNRKSDPEGLCTLLLIHADTPKFDLADFTGDLRKMDTAERINPRLYLLSGNRSQPKEHGQAVRHIKTPFTEEQVEEMLRELTFA